MIEYLMWLYWTVGVGAIIGAVYFIGESRGRQTQAQDIQEFHRRLADLTRENQERDARLEPEDWLR